MSLEIPILFSVLHREEQLKGDLRYLRDEYGIKLKMGRLNEADHPSIGWIDKLRLTPAAKAVKIFRGELSKYPPEYLQFCHPEHFRLVTSFLVSKRAWPEGCVLSSESGFFVYLHTNHAGEFPLRSVIHHELFQLSDHRDINNLFGQTDEEDGNQMTRKQFQESYLAEWISLNPNGQETYFISKFNYEKYLRQHRLKGTLPVRGFAMLYGRLDPVEDRATVAQLLLSNPKEADRRQQEDPILRAKLNEVLRILSQRSEGRMSGRFLKDLLAGRVKEGYWTGT